MEGLGPIQPGALKKFANIEHLPTESLPTVWQDFANLGGIGAAARVGPAELRGGRARRVGCSAGTSARPRSEDD